MNIDVIDLSFTDMNMVLHPSFDLLVPVLNEEKVIIKSLEKILNIFDALEIRYPGIKVRVIVVDNGSTDKTLVYAYDVSRTDARVSLISLTDRGKGLAIRTGFFSSGADLVGFTDVDLAANINCLPDMYEAICVNNLDLLYGSRYSAESIVSRSLLRGFTSKVYTKIFQRYLGSNIVDINCGLKIFNRKTIAPIFITVNENGWFFDSELIYLIEKNKLRIQDFPVDWREGADSKVKVISVSWDYLKNLRRIKRKYS